MRLSVKLLSDTVLGGAGRLLAPLDGPQPLGEEQYSWQTVMPDLGMPNAPMLAGRFVCRARPLSAAKFERHLKTPEILVAVSGDALICLAPPQEPSAEGLRGLEAFRLPKGQALLLERGAWHALPFPVGSSNVLLLVLFRDKTGDDDLDFYENPEAVELIVN